VKEFLSLLIHFDLKGLFLQPTTNPLLQFFRYVLVGGLATVVDWGVMFLLTESLSVHYLISAVFAFSSGLLTNYLLSRLLVFKASERRYSVRLEFLGYAFIGLAGLAFTELILYAMTTALGIHYMIAKVAATVIVLFWNYFARKTMLYKQ